MIISQTPLRFSFAGGGTDIPSFYKNNNYGLCINSTINNHIYVTINKQSKLYNENYRLNYSETELVRDIDNIKNPIIKGCLKFLNIEERLYISTTSDVPAASGLGTSSAFCVGLLNAMYKFMGKNASPGKLAEEASHIEINLLKRPVGKQDHYSAAYGGLNIIKFLSNEKVQIKKIFLSKKKINQLNNSFVSFWTGVTRNSAIILKKQNQNTNKNIDALIKLRNQVLVVNKILNNKNINFNHFGKIMDDGWYLKKNLSKNISNYKLNNLYGLAKKYGTLGGKIAGAGGGGFFLLVCHNSHHNKLTKLMEKKGLTKFDFSFSNEGSKVRKIY